jgi:hypothetical protein
MNTVASRPRAGPHERLVLDGAEETHPTPNHVWRAPRLQETVITRWPGALRAGASLGVPLIVGALIGHPSWGAVASLGSFAGFYGREDPYRHRLRLTAGVGAALVLLVLVGSLCSATPGLQIAFAGTTAAVSSFVCLSLRIPPPREYLIVLPALAAAALPGGPGAAGSHCALAAAGAVIAIAIGVSPRLFGAADRPERVALDGAWQAVFTVLETTGGPRPGLQQAPAVAAVRRARDTLVAAGTTAQSTNMRSLFAVEVMLSAALAAANDAQDPLSPELLVATRTRATGDQGELSPPTPNGSVELGVSIALARTRTILMGADDAEPVALSVDRGFERLRHGLSWRCVVLPAAARIGVTVTLAAAVGRVLGLDHGYWVALTATAALQGTSFDAVARRATERLFGTIAGVAIAAGVLAAHPPILALALIAAGCQFIAEILVGINYSAAVVFISVIALSVFDLAVGGGGRPGTIFGARVLDTIIGVAIVLILRRVLWPKATAARVPQAQALALRAAADLFAVRWQDSNREAGGVETARRRMQERLFTLSASTDDMLADHVGRHVGKRGRLSNIVEEISMLALGVPYDRASPSAAQTMALVDWLRMSANALDRSTATELARGDQSPVVPGYPRTTAAARRLGELLAEPTGGEPKNRLSSTVLEVVARPDSTELRPAAVLRRHGTIRRPAFLVSAYSGPLRPPVSHCAETEQPASGSAANDRAQAEL